MAVDFFTLTILAIGVFLAVFVPLLVFVVARHRRQQEEDEAEAATTTNDAECSDPTKTNAAPALPAAEPVKKQSEFWCAEAQGPNECVRGTPTCVDNVRHVCISLPYRDRKFQRVRDAMRAKHGFDVEKFTAVVGKSLDLRQFADRRVMHKNLWRHFKHTRKHAGHLGATQSHTGVWRMIVEENERRPVVVLEDDVVVDPEYRKLLEDRLRRLPQDWDICFLGMSCALNHYGLCRRNFGLTTYNDHITEVKHVIGLWGYAINGARSAEKLLDAVFPHEWLIDHHLSESALASGKVRAYASKPSILYHPGTTSVDAWNYTKSTPYTERYVSDTTI